MKYSISILVLLLCLLLIGCEKEVMLETVESSEVKMTFFSTDNISMNYANPVADKIAEETGVRIEVQLPIGEVNQRIDTMIISGDYTDFLMVKDTAYLVDVNALIDLEPLMREHAPNLMEFYKDYMNRLSYSNSDDTIYVLPTSELGNSVWQPRMGFELQHAVVKELGFPEIKTIYDYENALKAYIEKYPEINGKPTIGISLMSDDWRWMITIGNPGGFVNGLPDDGQWYINPTTYEANYRFSGDREKEFFRWLNHMYDIDLIDPDSFVQKYDAYEEKIGSGRVLGLIDAKWHYGGPEMILREKGLFERTYGQYPVQMDDTTLAAVYRDTGFLAGYGIGISVNCQDPVKAIKFLDYMVSEEGQILRNWGIEDLHYTIDENGVRHMTEDQIQQRKNDVNYAETTGVGNYIEPYPRYAQGELDESGNYYSTDTLSNLYDGYSEIEKEVLEAYGADRWSQLYPTADMLEESQWGVGWNIPIPEETGVQDALLTCDAIVKEHLITAIVSSPESFDRIWEEMQSKLEEAGVQDMNAAFTKLVKNRVEAWSASE